MKTGRKTIIAVVFDREGPGKLYAGARAEEAAKKFIGRATVTLFEIDAVYGLEELEIKNRMQVSGHPVKMWPPSTKAVQGLLLGLDAEGEGLNRRLKELEEKKKPVRLLLRVFSLLERGIVVTPDGGYGSWPEWSPHFNPLEGTLYFLSAEVRNYDRDVPFARGHCAYVVPREYFTGLDPRMKEPLGVPVVPLAEVKHDACPCCGESRPVMDWYQKVYGSPGGKLCEKITFLACCGLQVLHRREFAC